MIPLRKWYSELFRCKGTFILDLRLYTYLYPTSLRPERERYWPSRHPEWQARLKWYARFLYTWPFIADPPYLQLLRDAVIRGSNPHLVGRVEVINGKVEDEKIQAEALAYGKVDTIISEPIGVMLYHERMVCPL